MRKALHGLKSVPPLPLVEEAPVGVHSTWHHGAFPIQ